MIDRNEAERNTDTLKVHFAKLLSSEEEHGDIGIASFKSVYDTLMPVQKEKMRSIVAERFEELYESGSIICLAVSYKDPVIDFINNDDSGSTNYKLWNEYSKEYDRINQVQNRMSKDIAACFDGIALPATIGGVDDDVRHVRDYFEMVISHRVVAENAGVGWRGKNQLVIHDRFSCALRFSSVIVSIPFVQGTKRESKCGNCTACEDACTFIKNRESLPDYRENCRKYILFLKTKGIGKDVCGKCIKACYQESLMKNQFNLSR
ncbi:MAG: hypothetical protein P1Q69_08985 [Candidatus Thorarchaeota archaeon]|nr:hypothetical protein [Candidatus Thorarchaeota archaeon]